MSQRLFRSSQNPWGYSWHQRRRATMRLLDRFKSSFRDEQDEGWMRALRVRLLQESTQKKSLLSCLPLPGLAETIIDYEGLFSPPPIPSQPNPAQAVLLTKHYQTLLELRETGAAEQALRQLLTRFQPFSRRRLREKIMACLPRF